MERTSLLAHLAGFATVSVVWMITATAVRADGPQTPPASQEHEHVHQTEAFVPIAREGSGTAWLPQASPMYAIHLQRQGWELVVHSNGFGQFLGEAGTRGSNQFGSINWLMGMARRPVGPGRFGVRGMMSLEPWTIRGCGYPDLLATGERCEGEPIHDRQHQHDLFMEMALEYDAPVTSSLRWYVYGGPAAEPALGPVAYPHRISAMPNLLAPIAHHWFDATHVTFGVVTAGVYGARWKLEGSAFNGREPDEDRTDIDLGPFDSVSGRVWLIPTEHLVVQFSGGRLTDADPSEVGGRVDVTRVTASLTYHHIFREGGIWASTVAWGRNSEPEHSSPYLS
jgi:hypothetical protein